MLILGCAIALGASCYSQSAADLPADVGSIDGADDASDAAMDDIIADLDVSDTAMTDIAADPDVDDIGEPCILVTNAAGFDFGQRVVGQTHSTVFTIRNCSGPTTDQALEVHTVEWFEEDAAISLAALPGSLPHDPLVLNPGESSDIVVQFVPVPDVVSEAVLRIASNDIGRSPLDINIHGTGDRIECPTAVAGCRVDIRDDFASEVSAIPLQELHCDASQSFGADAAIAAYQWTVVDRPTGSVASFTPGPDVPNPNFHIDLAGRYTFRLNVIDDRNAINCEPANVTVVTGTNEAIHIQLVWTTPSDPDETDTSGTDLDLHFVHPIGTVGDLTYDVHYRNPNPNWGAGSTDPSLDINDTNGAGPENINFVRPDDGADYRVGVHYADDHGFGPSTATVRIYAYALLQFEQSRVLSNTDDYWDVATIAGDSLNVVRIDDVIPVCVASGGEFSSIGCP